MCTVSELVFDPLQEPVERRSLIFFDAGLSQMFEAFECFLVEISAKRASDISFNYGLYLADSFVYSIDFPVRYHLLKVLNRVDTSNLFYSIWVFIVWTLVLKSSSLFFGHDFWQDLLLLLFFNQLLLFSGDDVAPVHSLLFLILPFFFLMLDDFKRIIELRKLFCSILEDLLVRLHVFSDSWVQLRDCVSFVWIYDFVGHNLVKVLNCRVECLLGLKPFLDFTIFWVLLTEVKLLNEFCRGIPLLLSRFDQLRELVIPDIFRRRELHQIEDRLFLADVGIKHHEFWIRVLPLDYFGQEDFVGIYHRVDHGCEGPLILGSFDRKYNIYATHEMVPRHITLIAESQKLELLLYAVLLQLDIIVAPWSLASVLFLLLLWLRFQEVFVLLTYWDELLAIVIRFSMILRIHLFLIGIVDFSISLLNRYLSRVNLITLWYVFGIPFQAWKSLFPRFRKHLNCYI